MNGTKVVTALAFHHFAIFNICHTFTVMNSIMYHVMTSTVLIVSHTLLFVLILVATSNV